jgi:hypothetical protein
MSVSVPPSAGGRISLPLAPESQGEFLFNRSLSQRIADSRANPRTWEQIAVSASPSRSAPGGISLESTYRNSVTGETIHVHDVYKASGAQIPTHPSYRNYGKED